MDFDSYSSRLADITDISKEYFEKPKIKQKRFQIINESMQMKSVSKVQCGQLNDKIFYFSNDLITLPFGHPYLEDLRKEKHKYRSIHKVIQEKKIQFSKRRKQGNREDSKITYFKTNV